MTYRDERDRLILKHRELVSRIVRRLRWKDRIPKRIADDDLVGYGYLALVECAMRFDRNRGVSFCTFAYKRIEGGIRDSLQRENMIPRHIRRAAEKNGTSDRLPKIYSINENYSADGEGASWQDMLGSNDPGILEYLTRYEFPDRFWDSLQRRERKVLSLCFEYSLTTKCAARELGISMSRVQQIRAQIIEHARRYYKQHGFAGTQ